MTDTIGAGRLLLVTAHSDMRDLRSTIEAALREHASAADVRHLHAAAFVAYVDAAPSEVRDWLSASLRDGESAFVVEFERWSAFGEAADTRWLLRRGH